MLEHPVTGNATTLYLLDRNPLLIPSELDIMQIIRRQVIAEGILQIRVSCPICSHIE